MIKTKVTELLEIKYPILQGGMQWVGRAELASAVSNAGALGILTALTQPTPADLGKEIEKTKKMTDKPFGVNLTIMPTLKPILYDEYVKVIVESGVRVVETAGRSPEKFMPEFKKAGIKVIHKCTSVRHGLKAEKIGCDAISIDGFECAGHPGEDDIPNLILIPSAVDSIGIPIIGSGGFCDGRGLVAAMALGAEGINMGTRFMITREAPVHDNVKQALIAANELRTTLILRTLKNSNRVYNNSVAKKVIEIESKGGATIDDLAPFISGQKNRKVMEEGDIEYGTWSAGMVAGLIHDIPTANELIQKIMADAEKIIKSRLNSIVG